MTNTPTDQSAQPSTSLNASIETVELTLGSMTQQIQLVPPVAPYFGDRLYVSSTVSGDGDTVTIDVSDVRPGDQLPPGPFPATVTTVKLTVTYNGNVAVGQSVQFAMGNANLVVAVKLSADFTTGCLFVTDAASLPPPATATDLQFVLVQESGSDNGEQALYRMYWVSGITIDDATRFSTARIVDPAPLMGGGITGPMGVATP